MFLNQENRNRKQKIVFPTFHHKKHILIFAYIRKEKKEKQSWKDEAKKKASYKNEKPFFKTQTKTKHGKINQCKKNPTEKETEKTKFFWGEKKKSFAEVKDIFTQRVWQKEHRDDKKTKKEV